jgi:hypothetical protein
MNKSNIIICLGSLSALIGVWFFLHERSYAATDTSCIYGKASCLAETLQWIGVAQAFAGIAIVFIGLLLKDK